jgi:hypothetical protein
MLTMTGVSAQSLGGSVLPRPGSGVDGGGLDDAVYRDRISDHSYYDFLFFYATSSLPNVPSKS